MSAVARAVAALFFILVSCGTLAFSEADYGSLDEVGTGSLLIRQQGGYQPFLRSRAEFDVQVSGLVSQVTLRQEFVNPSQEWVEAVYVLPLPEDSAVNAMRLRIGERVIEGEIKEKQEARRIYTQAKAQGKRAGLLQQQRPNLFSTQVANIGPGETVAVELRFLQTLHFLQGAFSLRLPMTLTPRYIPGTSLQETPPQDVQGWAFATDQVPDANLISPPQTHQAAADQMVASLQVSVNAGFDVEGFDAPYHAIQVGRSGREYQIRPHGQTVPMDRDFVLSWKPVARQAPVAAYFSEQVSGRDHGLIMVMPPAPSAALQIGPRELILIIDSSGSMSGQSMVQAKQAVQMALGRLRPQDRFNVIDFDSGYRTLFPRPAAATPGALRRASFFVEGLTADGGTEMLAPLQAALSQVQTEMEDRGEDKGETVPVTQVVFITDGSVGNEQALFELIHQRIGDKRLYTVGIGSAPNGYFMRKAAEFGRGTYTYIGSTDEVQTRMAELFGRIEKPALTQIEIQVQGAAAEVYPQPVPDLFLGEPLLIKARFDQAPGGVVIKGRFQGQPWQTALTLQAGDQGEGIATLWARAKVANLQDDGVRQGNASLHRQEIIALGIEHRLVTPYTSFVAVDKTPVRPQDTALQQEQVANRMPAGSQQSAPGVGYPRTALGLQWHMLIGLLLLGAALLLWQRTEFGGGCDADLA
ncbi:MAG: marine proteobacterial sortase target protein [Pseudomonadota bacterium]|nr:marine proteobacterial sortase target protein [Pseudomonadota bacterium]